MSQSVERRQAPRAQVLPVIICRLQCGDRCYEGSLRDMSVTGIFVELEDQLRVSDECEAEIILQGEYSSIKIEGLQGRVVRCDIQGCGIEFDGRLEWFSVVSTYFFRRM